MIELQWLVLAVVLPQLFTLGTALVNASQGPEALATRNYFYVGGRYVNVMLTRLKPSR